MNKYPIDEIDKMSKQNRKIGLGVMGFADMLVQLAIPYNSKQALKLADKLMGFIHKTAHEESIELAKKIEKVDNKIIIAAQSSDIYELTKATKLKVYAQHVDPRIPGRNTGYIIPEAVKKDKAKGTFLNHSEHPISFNKLKKTIKRCKKINLKTMVFVADVKKAKRVEKLKPDYLIYEI